MRLRRAGTSTGNLLPEKPLGHRVAAVDRERDAGYEVRGGRGKEDRRANEIAWFTPSSCRRTPGILFALGDFPMMWKLLLGVRERAEGLAVGDTERS